MMMIAVDSTADAVLGQRIIAATLGWLGRGMGSAGSARLGALHVRVPRPGWWGFSQGHAACRAADVRTPLLTNTWSLLLLPKQRRSIHTPVAYPGGTSSRPSHTGWASAVGREGPGPPGRFLNWGRAGGRTSGTRRLVSRALRRRPSNGGCPPGAKRQEAGAQTPAPSARHQQKSPRRGRRVAALHFTLCGRAALASPLTVPAAVPGEGTWPFVSCTASEARF